MRDMWASSARYEQTCGFGRKSPVPARNKLCLPARPFSRASRSTVPREVTAPGQPGVCVHRVPVSLGVIASSVCVGERTPPTSRHIGRTSCRLATPGYRGESPAGMPVGERRRHRAKARIAITRGHVHAIAARVESPQIHGAFDRQLGRSHAEWRGLIPLARLVCRRCQSHPTGDDTRGSSFLSARVRGSKPESPLAKVC